MNRRQALAALGTSALPSVTGCANLEAELGMRSNTLAAVTLVNRIADPFKVSLEVLRDGTLVHQESYQLDPGSGRGQAQYTINEWKENPNARRWTVRAKIPEIEWREATIDADRGSKTDCYTVYVVTAEWTETPLQILLGDCESDNRKQ
ncbi:hypothetical protein [Halonotius aquaticus]|uniref:hypothetical protein n=1 Tax=Halonotius aquaticus TaxID=2216978 RepID=UPI001058B761|nr:hypothetical protein [Halonotius aquaticus]